MGLNVHPRVTLPPRAQRDEDGPKPVPPISIMHRPLRRLLAFLFCLSLAALAGAETPTPLPGIRVDTVGFLPGSPKVATVNGAGDAAETFAVVSEASGEPVWTGPLGPAMPSISTPEVVRLADFSTFTQPGSYHLAVEGLPASPTFEIAHGALNRSLETIMIGFYGQRCGVAVHLEHDGDVFAHGPCHLDDGWLDYYDPARAGEKKIATGGWHDAGDYGKYAVNSGFTHGMMLAAWEQFGDKLQHLELPIPERGGDLPDYLDEVRFNLEWLLTQQMEDGRVAHKLTRLRFGPLDIKPEDDLEKRYFAPWGTAANANFTASMAQAARVFAPYDPEFAARCRAAAIKAWEAMQPAWREVRPDLSAFRTGTYMRSADQDVFWAAIELSITAPEAFDENARRRLESALMRDDFAFSVDWDWGQGKNLGLYSYLFAEGSPRDPAIVQRLQEDLVLAADRIVANTQRHAYGRGLSSYYWGVNGAIARATMNLYGAYRVTGQRKYLDAAFAQIAYLYGRNPFGRSFVTGDGDQPPLFPHHRPSVADAVEAPWPGHLVSGAHPTEMDYYDETQDPAHNENAINWDGALAYALAIFYEPDAE